MEKENKVIAYFTNLAFFLYFFTLLGERSFAFISSITDGRSEYLSDVFDVYWFVMHTASISTWGTFRILFCREGMAHIAHPKKYPIPYKNLAIASGIILVSGMIHTPHTVTWLQFVAYGFLLLGMFFYVINHKPTLSSILSYLFISAYSMAIPVVYRSFMATYGWFQFYEAVTSLVILGFFTYLLCRLYEGKGQDLFHYPAVVAAIVLDIPLVIWRWEEERNYFIIVALSATVAIFIIGRAYLFARRFRARRHEREELEYR